MQGESTETTSGKAVIPNIKKDTIDFEFTGEQGMLRKTVREFLNKECPRKLVRKLDGEGGMPGDVGDDLCQKKSP